MAIREPAHPLEKRDLLHNDKLDRKRITAIAQSLASEGRWPEAIDYIEVAPDPALLATAETYAVKNGSAWLLQQIERIRGTKAAPADWERLSDAAAAASRWRDAIRAMSLAGQPERAEALRLEKCPEYDPFKPLGK